MELSIDNAIKGIYQRQIHKNCSIYKNTTETRRANCHALSEFSFCCKCVNWKTVCIQQATPCCPLMSFLCILNHSFAAMLCGNSPRQCKQNNRVPTFLHSGSNCFFTTRIFPKKIFCFLLRFGGHGMSMNNNLSKTGLKHFLLYLLNFKHCKISKSSGNKTFLKLTLEKNGRFFASCWMLMMLTENFKGSKIKNISCSKQILDFLYK